MKVTGVEVRFEEHRYRTPYMFGGREVDRVTLCNVECRVEDAGGRTARGFGSMPLGNQWAWPSQKLDYAQTLEAMKGIALAAAPWPQQAGAAHPLRLGWEVEAQALRFAASLRLAEAVPKLAVLVAISPLDAALHDAYGKLLRRPAWHTYGPEHAPPLDEFLGADFRGKYGHAYLRRRPVGRVALFHSVGASDPLLPSDIQTKLDDGLPQALGDWIAYNGIIRIKIKLNGADILADIERTVVIDRIAAEAQARRGVKHWLYCVDFNERCPNVDALLEYLRKVKERAPSGFDRILYVEQPTARDLRADRANAMHKAAALRPVVIDESLVDRETLQLAREMGYTGVALKACKGQTQTVLMAAAAQQDKMFLCVQDLTCPGASFVHSVGIAAWVPGAAGVEGNARQYVPSANQGWAEKHPGLFRVTDGWLRTTGMTRPGLGAV
jgi:L-alanine-DL-glutamate epimerase-like enolase superfamily enzyme